MEIYRHIEEGAVSAAGSVATLGNFDGIHLGHQALLRSAVRDAVQLGSRSVVLTFEPHPLKVLAPARAPKLILTHKDKMELFQSFGIDIVAIQKFDTSFAALSAQAFVNHVLVERLRVKKIWVGRDLRFGQGRKGSVQDLLRWGAGFSFEVGVVEHILVDGVRVSSSRIRELLDAGRVDNASALLGRHHFISGRVVAGQRRGKALGFPTANISTRTEVVPADGIYATLFQLRGKTFLSVSSVGVNPTFGDGPRTIESFILDFDGDIYGAAVKLFFVKRIRGEMKFSSADLLAAKIHEDVACARAIFAGLGLTACAGTEAGC